MKKAKGIFVVLIVLSAVVFLMGTFTVRNDKNPTGTLDQEGYLLISDRAHNENHYSHYYSFSYFRTVSVANTSTNFIFQTGSKLCYVAAFSSSLGLASFQLYEGAVAPSDGALTPISNNRNRILASTVSLSLATQVTSAGTLLINAHIPANIPTRCIGRVRADDEMIFAPNTRYLLVLADKEGSNKDHELTVAWYEE